MPSSSRALHQPTPGVDVRPSEEGGRPCGCDPRAGHICEQHRTHVDVSESEIRGAYQLGRSAVNSQEVEQAIVLVVTGPDAEGEFGLLGAGGEWTMLPRFVAEDLVYELSKRLAARE